jgi:hypothetical protein
MSDGRIDIDTRLDPEGFKEGMNGVLSETQKGVKAVVKSMAEMSDAWVNMGWGQKSEVIAKTIERVGEEWNQWDIEKQNAALMDTLNEVKKVKDEVTETKDETKKLANETIRHKSALDNVYKGIYNIAAAFFPSLYRVDRMKRGIEEIGNSSIMAFGEMTAGATVSTIAVGALEATIGAVAIALIVIIAIIAVVAAALAAMTIGAVMGFKSMIDQMSSAVSITNQYGADIAAMKSLFADLQGAVYAAFSPLFYAAKPWIEQIIAWLIEAINLVAMIIAKITGQSSYQKYIAGSMDKAAGSAGKLAKETQKVEGAAKGALAAFDEINVLQQETADNMEPTAMGGGLLGGGTGEFVTTAVDEQAIADQWERVKNGFLVILSEIWDAVVDFVDNQLLPWIETNWPKLVDWFYNTFIPRMVTGFINLLSLIISVIVWGISIFINLFLAVLIWIYTYFIVPAWELFKGWVNDVCEEIQKIVNWFVKEVVEPFMKNVTSFCDDMLEAFDKTWHAIHDVVKGIINKIIDLINGMLHGLQEGINSAINAINNTLIGTPGFRMLSNVYFHDVPHLAKGAVIPPNSQFLAMLGDQRSGRNIEAPEDLIRQIVREETEGMSKDVNVNFTGTMGELIRVLRPEITREDYRTGPSLIDGVTA